MRKLKSILILAIAIGGLFSNAVNADTWTAVPGKVTYVNMWTDGFTFVIDGQNETCSNGSNQFFVRWGSDPTITKQLYAMVLSAFYTGDYLAVNWGCDYEGRKATTNIDLHKAP